MESREVRTACHCAGGPHEFDLFTLAEDVPIPAGIAVATALSSPSNEGEYNLAVLVTTMLEHGGIESWNLVDDEGSDLVLSPANVRRRVTWRKGGMELTNAAYKLWVNGKDLAPFGLPSSPRVKGKSSPTGPTASSTSPRTRSSSKRPAPSA